MVMSLRQRNRMAAIQAIQATAITLFDKHGYQAVTVEDIARGAGVSASTFYRYFGTKEGVFTVDTFTLAGGDSFRDILDLDDPVETMRRLAESAGEAGPWPGMRYVMEEPSVRAAVYAAADGIAGRITDLLVERGTSPIQARVLARTFVFGVYIGSIEQWYLDGRRRPVTEYAAEAVAAVRPTTA